MGVPGKLKVHLGLAEKSFITLTEREQAKIGGRLMEVLLTVSDGALVPLLNFCLEEAHVRKLCVLKGIVFNELSSSPLKEELKDEPVDKKVAVKKAQAKQGKIYVGKIPQELSDEEIKSFFEQYGAIVMVEQPFDKMKNERKNFCFVTFEKEEPAKKLLKEETVNVSGNELVIKKVTPKQGDMRGGGRGGRGGGGFGGGQWGGYGGGWGGYGGYDQMGGGGGQGRHLTLLKFCLASNSVRGIT